MISSKELDTILSLRFFPDPNGGYNTAFYKLSIKQIQRICKLTASQVNYRLQIALQKPQITNIAPVISDAQKAYLTSIETLTRDAAMSLDTRAQDFSSANNTILRPKQLRKIYLQAGVKYKKLIPSYRPRRPRSASLILQDETIFRTFATAIARCQRFDQEIIMIDESTFSQHSYNRCAWAPKTRNVICDNFQHSQPPISVCAAVSNKRGLICFSLAVKSHNASTFSQFLTQLQAHLPQDPSYVLLLDNSSIHKSSRVTKYIRSRQIPIAWNKPHSPQYNGIELYWALVKRNMRQTITKITTGHISNESLQTIVTRALLGVPIEKVKACCDHALKIINRDMEVQRNTALQCSLSPGALSV